MPCLDEAPYNENNSPDKLKRGWDFLFFTATGGSIEKCSDLSRNRLKLCPVMRLLGTIELKCQERHASRLSHCCKLISYNPRGWRNRRLLFVSQGEAPAQDAPFNPYRLLRRRMYFYHGAAGSRDPCKESNGHFVMLHGSRSQQLVITV